MDALIAASRKARRAEREFERNPNHQTKREYYSAHANWMRVERLYKLDAVKFWVKRSQLRIQKTK